MQKPYRFSIMSGMDGYMPNYTSGPFIVHTRKDFAAILRDELEMLNYPANRIRDFGIRRAWRFVQNVGDGSSCHLSCDDHNHECLRVNGLTEQEYDEMEAQQDW